MTLSAARRAALLAAALFAAGAAPGVQALPLTECSGNGVCYCMNSDFKPVIDSQVDKLRGLIAAERARGKAVGYLSLPLSTLGGSYFDVNAEVGVKTKERVEARLGPSSAWVLNPGMREASIPDVAGARAGGAEYMVMWTRVLEATSGLGEDFDFVYFAGPSDFAAYFGLTGIADMDRIAAFYEERLKSDAGLRRLVEQGRMTPIAFRNYYGLRASVSFSLGAHDEWNIVGKINARRRVDAKFGTGNQLPSWFDGRAVSSAQADQPMSTGYAGNCKVP